MEYNNDFKHDLKVGQLKEEALGEIFNGSTIEVKYDQQAYNTGNIFVEYQSRGKPSGLSTTQAEYYCYVLSNDTGDTFHLMKTDMIKNKCRAYMKTKRDIVGGDSNTSKGILLPIKELL